VKVQNSICVPPSATIGWSFKGYSRGPLSGPEVFLGRSSGEPKWYMQGASYVAVGLHGGISIRLGYVSNPGALGVWAERSVEQC